MAIGERERYEPGAMCVIIPTPGTSRVMLTPRWFAISESMASSTVTRKCAPAPATLSFSTQAVDLPLRELRLQRRFEFRPGEIPDALEPRVVL